MDSARSSNSTATTPRDDRFYTPRANSIANSSDGEYFTPRFNNNGSGKFGAGAGDLTNRSARSDSDSWQTPRSARVDEPPAVDPRFRRSLSRESSLNNVTGSASSSPRMPHISAPSAHANIPSSSASSNYYYGPNSGSSSGGGGNNNCMSPVHEEAEDCNSVSNGYNHSYNHGDHFAGSEQRQHQRPAPGPSGLYGQSQGPGQGRGPAPRSGPFNYSPQLRNGSGRVDSPSAPAAPADSLPYPHKSPPWGQGRHRPSAQQPGSGHSAGSSASTPTSSPSVGARLQQQQQQRQGYGYGGSGLMGEPVYTDGWTSPHPNPHHQHQHPAAANSSPGHGRPHAYAHGNGSSGSESKLQDDYGRHGYNESKGQGQGHVHDPYNHSSYADEDAEVVVDHGYGDDAEDDDGYGGGRGGGRGARDTDPDVGGLVDDFEDADVLGVEDGVTARDVEDVFRFARHSRAEEMEKLLDAGIPVNIRDEHGATLLIIACQNGNKKILKSCLRRGADINARNFKGNTALHFCYQFGYGETLGQYLISKGADTQIRNKAGKTYFQGT